MISKTSRVQLFTLIDSSMLDVDGIVVADGSCFDDAVTDNCGVSSSPASSAVRNAAHTHTSRGDNHVATSSLLHLASSSILTPTSATIIVQQPSTVDPAPLCDCCSSSNDLVTLAQKLIDNQLKKEFETLVNEKVINLFCFVLF